MTTLTSTADKIYSNRHQTIEVKGGLQLTTRPDSSPTIVDIVIPVYNEARSLPGCIATLHAYVTDNFPYQFQITIVDNGSTDATWQIAQALQVEHDSVAAIHLTEKGRGRALKYAWERSQADVLAYMDVDLSTDLSALEPLLTPLVRGEAELATGSRLQKASRVRRSFKRECISRSYNYILRAALRFKTSDAQCGFKAIRRGTALRLLPQIVDNAWFFDTELLAKAADAGYKIHEVPVQWREDPDSRVNIVHTAIEDLKGVARVRAELSPRSKLEKLAIAGLLALTGILYIVGMLQNGYANSFYAAAVQAGTVSWKAFFFGSIDASNYITVDKPPFSLWLMELSTRIFGFHSWSMLLPNVLAGLIVVYLVYAMVRRWFGARSALIAAGVMAFTPVAALMFGFNNPDALLTLLLTGSMYAFLRALEGKRPLLWLAIAGILTGSAFNTKMLQGFFLLPVFGIVYLISAPRPFFKRLSHLILAVIPTAIATLWWPVVVWLVPAANRPYIGSSTDNSIWNLIFGYNGFGRLLGTGSDQGGTSGMAGPGGGGGMAMKGPGGTGFGGSTGVFRMFNNDFGPNIAWFIVAALLGSGLVIWLRRKLPRTDKVRTAVLAFLGWLLVHMVLFSMVGGVIHPYYVLALAPAVAAIIGITVPIMVSEYRRGDNTAFVLPLAIVATGITALIILGYQPTWLPWLRWAILASAVVSGLLLLLNLISPLGRAVKPALIAAAIACTAGPLAFTLATISVAHTGSIPTAGPTATAMAGSNNESASAESSFVAYLLKNRGAATWIVAVASANDSASIQITSGQPVMAIGGFNGSDNAITLAQFKALVASGQLRYYATGGNGNGRGGMGMGGNSEIASWVTANATEVSYGGSDYTLYDLSTAVR